MLNPDTMNCPAYTKSIDEVLSQPLPDPKGYEIWADAMEPYLKAFLKGEPLPCSQMKEQTGLERDGVR